MTDLDPETLIRELNIAQRSVASASTKLAKLIKEYEGANGQLGIGTRYEIALDDELTGLYDEHVENDKRPPAEDIRAAMARRRVRTKHPELDADNRRLTTEIKALTLWIRDQKVVINAKQSVLNGVRGLGA